MCDANSFYMQQENRIIWYTCNNSLRNGYIRKPSGIKSYEMTRTILQLPLPLFRALTRSTHAMLVPVDQQDHISIVEVTTLKPKLKEIVVYR